jgi:hypothetical protein
MTGLNDRLRAQNTELYVFAKYDDLIASSDNIVSCVLCKNVRSCFMYYSG